MMYLKTCIKGAAAKLIAHIEATAENYRVCYELLTRRYDNKREVLSKLINNILRSPEIEGENSAQLRNMHDTVHECVMTIKNMGIQVVSWGPLLVHRLLRKIDKESSKQYEFHLKGNRGNCIKCRGNTKRYWL